MQIYTFNQLNCSSIQSVKLKHLSVIPSLSSFGDIVCFSRLFDEYLIVMRTKNIISLVSLFWVLSTHCFAQTPVKPMPIPVIFDTDVGNDIDDVLALQMLFNYEKENKIDLLGITISKSNPRVVEYVDAYCRFNDRGDIPLGYAYNGVNPEPFKYVPTTLDTLVNGKKVLYPRRSLASDIPEGYILQRQLLARQQDRSVVMIVVGPETNIQRLLESGPDEYSKLTGVELVKKKVRLLSVMGGLYDNKFDFPEWNIVQDLRAAKTLFEKWPIEIVASGWELGNELLYPHQSILQDFDNVETHPLAISYQSYQKMPYDRQTWDLTSVLYAIEPDEGHFDLSKPGIIAIDSDGNSLFKVMENGKHRYLIIPDNKKGKTLKRIVDQVTGKSDATYQ